MTCPNLVGADASQVAALLCFSLALLAARTVRVCACKSARHACSEVSLVRAGVRAAQTKQQAGAGRPACACRALGQTCRAASGRGGGSGYNEHDVTMIQVRVPRCALQMYQVRMDKATAQHAQQEAARRRPLSAQPTSSREFVVTPQDRQGLRTAQVR